MVASRAAIAPANPWVTRTSPASAAPTLPNSTLSRSARAAPIAAPLDEDLLGVEGADAAQADLDGARRRLADPAALDRRTPPRSGRP